VEGKVSVEKGLGEELLENKAVQAGGTSILAFTLSQIGISTGALGVVAATKFGLILSTLGPFGLAAGGVLLVGGAVYTIANSSKKRK
jgi:hypothetical protein